MKRCLLLNGSRRRAKLQRWVLDLCSFAAVGCLLKYYYYHHQLDSSVSIDEVHEKTRAVVNKLFDGVTPGHIKQ
jgi:hypothetical protein